MVQERGITLFVILSSTYTHMPTASCALSSHCPFSNVQLLQPLFMTKCMHATDNTRTK